LNPGCLGTTPNEPHLSALPRTEPKGPGGPCMSVIEPPMPTCSDQLSDWVSRVRFGDLPSDVVEQTTLRVLDVLGLVLAGLGTPFGRSVREAVLALNPTGPSRIFGRGDATTVPGAA